MWSRIGILKSCFRIFLHNLLMIIYPTAQQEDFEGKDQRTIVLEGNDIPYDGCNAIVAAKMQRNILRDYFMNEGQVPSEKDSR